MAYTKVAVIIASHDRPKFVCEALQSALDQIDLDELQIHIIDNGSKEPTKQVIEKYLAKNPYHLEFPYPRTIHHVRLERPYSSPASIYNEGLSRITADVDLVAFLDDDNLFFGPSRLATGIIQMERTGADMVRSDGLHFGEDEGGKPFSTTVLSPESILSIGENPNLDVIHPNDLIIKRKVIDQIGGFDELLESSIGIEYTIRAQRAGFKVFRSAIPEVKHRVWAGQRSMASEYATKDAKGSRPWIAAKERFMRKNFKVFIFGSDDPYRADMIKHIPWTETTYLKGLPSFTAAKLIAEKRPNLVVHTNMLVGSEQEMQVFAGCPAISLGLTRTKDVGGEWIVPNEKLPEVVSYYPAVNWYVTDDEDAVGQRVRVMLTDNVPSTDAEALAFWTEILSVVRVNHYIG